MEADAGVEDEREDVECPAPLVDLTDFNKLRPAAVGLHFSDESAEVLSADGVVHPVVAKDRPGGVRGQDTFEVGRFEVTVFDVALKGTAVNDGLEDIPVSLVQPSDPGLNILEETFYSPPKGDGGSHRAAEGHDGGSAPARDGLLTEIDRPEGSLIGREIFPERLEDFSEFFPVLHIRKGLKGRRGEECELVVKG